MDNKDIAGGAIGSVGKWDIAFKENQLVLEADANKEKSSLGLVLKIDARDVLDAIKAKIPGQIDDAVINVLELALLGPAPAAPQG